VVSELLNSVFAAGLGINSDKVLAKTGIILR
jgi:hypothetical protein